MAQAVATQVAGPRAPVSIEIWPAASLMIMRGMKKGEIFPGPFSKHFRNSSSHVLRLPIPEPTNMPMRSRSTFFKSSLARATASLAAITAY